MAKFDALAEYCRAQTLHTFTLPFAKIEAIISSKLPPSAARPQYWANTLEGGSPVRAAMRDTRYETFLVAGSRKVEFRRV